MLLKSTQKDLENKKLVEYFSDGIAVIEDGIVTECNSAIVNMMGASSKEQLVSLHLSKLSPEFQDDGALSYIKVNEMLKLCKDKGSHNFEWICKRMSNEDFWTSISLTAMHQDGRNTIVSVWRDINEKKILELELEKSNEKYKLLEKELEAKVKAKTALLLKEACRLEMDNLIKTIGHQWRQPLSSIGALSANMQMDIILSQSSSIEEGNKDFFQKSLQDIDATLQKLSSTIDSFLSPYSSDRVKSLCSVKELIEDALQTVGESYKKNSITVKKKIDSNIDVFINKEDMSRAIVYLLQNSEDALLLSRAEMPFVDINVTKNDKFIKIDICDNAMKIDDNIRGNLFNPYFSTKSELNGKGLGLYLASTIVKYGHNGNLYLDEFKEMTCFSIELPLD
ncbi:PAS domain-containing protein [Sulfurimonas aquatica]|uniref:histidine kinase n=1 Tax=Sulfurimonas aquatica TaxID=2672570 RepID=A0A975AYE1_9BACT|nr:PAS domain-containing sensor histidine kinase [Sulfurimonas aquatica]QSZ40829.1 PAS domain-containing protein [Sulfurimonas aquatica]